MYFCDSLSHRRPFRVEYQNLVHKLFDLILRKLNRIARVQVIYFLHKFHFILWKICELADVFAIAKNLSARHNVWTIRYLHVFTQICYLNKYWEIRSLIKHAYITWHKIMFARHSRCQQVQDNENNCWLASLINKMMGRGVKLRT